MKNIGVTLKWVSIPLFAMVLAVLMYEAAIGGQKFSFKAK
jgi:hypothetical protein